MGRVTRSRVGDSSGSKQARRKGSFDFEDETKPLISSKMSKASTQSNKVKKDSSDAPNRAIENKHNRSEFSEEQSNGDTMEKNKKSSKRPGKDGRKSVKKADDGQMGAKPTRDKTKKKNKDNKAENETDEPSNKKVKVEIKHEGPNNDAPCDGSIETNNKPKMNKSRKVSKTDAKGKNKQASNRKRSHISNLGSEFKKEKPDEPVDKKSKKTESKRSQKSSKPSTSKSPTKHSQSSLSPKKPSAANNISLDMDDIKGLLMRFEQKESVDVKQAKDEDFMDSSSEEEEWEDVEHAAGEHHASPKKSEPAESVEITLEATSIMRKKRKKKRFDIAEWFRLEHNRKLKQAQAHAHQVHLLCLLAHGYHRSSLCSKPNIQATMLSIIPAEYHNLSSKSWGLVKLTQLTTWFTRSFPLYPDDSLVNSSAGLPQDLVLCERIQAKVAGDKKELVCLFVCMCRVLGLDARIVISLKPMTYKATGLKAKPKDGDEETPVNLTKETAKKQSDSSKPSTSAIAATTKSSIDSSSDKKSSSTATTKHKSEKSKEGNPKTIKSNDSSKSKGSKNSSKETEKRGKEKTVSQKIKALKRRSSSEKAVNYCEGSEDEDGNKKYPKKKGKSAKKTKTENDSDEAFEEENKKFRSPASNKAVSKLKKKPKRMISTDDEHNPHIPSADTNVWAEVYLENEKGWVCVDVSKNLVNCRESMAPGATQPISYIIAFQQGYLAKDVTPKYTKNWLLEISKQRLDQDWWQETMSHFRPRTSRDKTRDQREDQFIKSQLHKTPMPSAISDFKNHPLYALKRHLLKFEAIYPPDAVPMGYVKSEPVYARECIHTLRSRETWLKEARMVRLKEEPYKYVKGRPKKNQVNYNPEDKNLEIFGFWQTEDYIPMPAVNGKIPRNAYGNIELFKPSMLPGGTVHLQIPGLNKVARKLNIDCVPAMVGWEAHCGYSHPILDGFIVCEEHKDTLLAAWDEEQEIAREREIEKREKRVIDNWTRLTRGLLIRKRLKEKYDLTDPHGQEAKKKTAAKKAKNKPSVKKSDAHDAVDFDDVTVDISQAWPMNRQAEKKREKEQNQRKSNAARKKKTEEKGHLFPFEMETI